MPLMPTAARKVALVGHVISSAGWLGAVAAFLALAVVALHTADATTSQALYVAMEILGKAVLLPLAFASLLTGLLQALGTSWGLFRHWWVIVKLALTVESTAVLLAYTSTLVALADAARDPSGHSAYCRRRARCCTRPQRSSSCWQRPHCPGSSPAA